MGPNRSRRDDHPVSDTCQITFIRANKRICGSILSHGFRSVVCSRAARLIIYIYIFFFYCKLNKTEHTKIGRCSRFHEDTESKNNVLAVMTRQFES